MYYIFRLIVPVKLVRVGHYTLYLCPRSQRLQYIRDRVWSLITVHILFANIFAKSKHLAKPTVFNDIWFFLKDLWNDFEYEYFVMANIMERMDNNERKDRYERKDSDDRTVMSYMTEPKLIEDLMKMTTIKYMMN